MIICGSKPVSEPVDHIVDSFDVIVRHNMLIHGQGYGNKPSTIQVLNQHVYANRNNFAAMVERYVDTGLVSIERVQAFYDWHKFAKGVQFIEYPLETTELIQDIVPEIPIKMGLRAGFAMIARAILDGIRPTLIGFSLTRDDLLCHQIGYAEGKMSPYHCTDTEIRVLNRLIEVDLVDGRYL